MPVLKCFDCSVSCRSFHCIWRNQTCRGASLNGSRLCHSSSDSNVSGLLRALSLSLRHYPGSPIPYGVPDLLSSLPLTTQLPLPSSHHDGKCSDCITQNLIFYHSRLWKNTDFSVLLSNSHRITPAQFEPITHLDTVQQPGGEVWEKDSDWPNLGQVLTLGQISWGQEASWSQWTKWLLPE